MDAKDIRLLVVDDEPAVLASVSGLFAVFGFSVATAKSGNEALAHLAQNPAHIVISDIRMSGGDGISLLRALRDHHYDRPAVLFMSGFSDIQIDDVYALGVDGFFSKPFSAATVRDVIKQCLLRLQDRWQIKPGQRPSAAFTAVAPALSSSDPHATFRFGRRGFFMGSRMEFPEVGELIDFKLDVTTKKPVPQVEGLGRVRWVRRNHHKDRASGFGVEVVWLADNCREKVVEWIEANQPRATIPLT